MSSLKYWFWLAERKGIGLVRAKALIDHFGSAERVYNADERDYLAVEGIKQTDVKILMQKELGTANKILSDCAESGSKIMTLNDSNYPECLRNIYDPPLILYMKGNLPYIDDEPVVGVVGTRKCTPYGITTAENVGYELSKNGIIVVTGLAKGVDTAATRGALRGGSSVIGVIGSGLDIVYPPGNKELFDDVACKGAVISEYPPGTPPLPENFPMRNRIISGLSRGVAVIEAPKKSGALITAARALEQGRDVFALPGNVDAITCEGSNALLREGAIPFLSAGDIIDEYIELYPEKMSGKENSKRKISFDNTSKVDYIDLGNLLGLLDGDEKAIAKSIGHNFLLVDEIILETGLPAQKVLSSLTILELNGYVSRDNSGRWQLQ
ncbi:MAG: DNA-processing protein DprA [Oscillospiraceae bacterium]|nr:DNA-processing protein DprA [Oscillospiraceae bacterium]